MKPEGPAGIQHTCTRCILNTVSRAKMLDLQGMRCRDLALATYPWLQALVCGYGVCHKTTTELQLL